MCPLPVLSFWDICHLAVVLRVCLIYLNSLRGLCNCLWLRMYHSRTTCTLLAFCKVPNFYWHENCKFYGGLLLYTRVLTFYLVFKLCSGLNISFTILIQLEKKQTNKQAWIVVDFSIVVMSFLAWPTILLLEFFQRLAYCLIVKVWAEM